eukprot:CAMPEP_0202017226 /NCGR_PEP_ID=MMETSP0905-20130828/36474_1 /ASSEMBLY_ACC=CAM_ASM_000554 /TAXON_ID=420261 /ORGANISM="Thalassiosira antarctica, Strain CCMP982" /LENGTH=476 /DNA_ID=CAMNT_0048577829 /DNA_START=70 /DNA_END=1500 /DNA_ORIENTATION=-
MSINLYPDEVRKAHLDLGDPEYYPEIDVACEEIYEATKGFGTDERSLIVTLGSKDTIERCLIAYRYKEKYGKELKDLMKSENSGDFGFLTQLLSLPAPEAEAKIIRKATKGLGTNEKLLWPVICGRSNEEIDILKKTYFKRYNKDLTNLISSELSGDIKKLHLACLQGMEETYDPSYHNASKAEEDAVTFYKKGQGKWGTDEKALFEIICKSPPQYLKMVDDAYVAKNNINLEKALTKGLHGKARQAAVFTLGMKLSPYETAAEYIKSTCAGMGTDELGLSCAILRYQHILPRVMIEHTNLFSKSIGDRISSETRGDYQDLLLEMVRVAWPNSISVSDEEEDDDSDEVVGDPEYCSEMNNPRVRAQIIADIRSTSGESYYHRAADQGDLDALREAVDTGLSDVLHVADSNGWTPLHEAVRAGHVDIVEYLVQEVGLDINEETNGGDSTISLALEHHGANHPVTVMVQTLLHQIHHF